MKIKIEGGNNMVEIAPSLADFVRETKFSDLPEHLVNDMKLLLLDAVGCAIRGHSSECDLP